MKTPTRVKTASTKQLLELWDLTESMNRSPELPTVRGWLMDEMEARDPAGFEAWMESEDPKGDLTMGRVKKYSELAEGDRVWWYGYKGTVRDIRVTHTCESGPYKGERVYRFAVDLEPSRDHIEKTIYNGGVYGGVESLTVALRD